MITNIFLIPYFRRRKLFFFTGVAEDDVYELYGVYWVLWTMRSGHDALFKTLGDTLPTFLSGLDFLHSVYMKTMYSDMTVPQFRVEEIDDDEDTILLHYISSRFNMWAVVAGKYCKY